MQTDKMHAIIKPLAILCGRVILLALIAQGVIHLLDYARYSPSAASLFQLEQIRYRGLVHLDAKTLDRLIEQTASENVLLVDLDRVRELVEDQAWIQEASVRRKLPNALVVHVLEREPAAVAAIDNELYVVDREGSVLDRFGPDYQTLDGPIVQGLQNVALENAREENTRRIEAYLRVLSALEPYREAISEIDVENPERIGVVPADEPVCIYLGKERFQERYETFMSQKDLYERLKRQYGTIESVDVTYEDKIIFHTRKAREKTAATKVLEQS